MTKKSLLKQSEETAIAIPNIGGMDSLDDQGRSFEPVPYVAFVHPLMKPYAKVMAALPNAEEGDPIVIMPEPDEPKALNPFVFLLVRSWHYFGKFDNQGQLEAAVARKEDKPKGDRKFTDVIETVLILVTDGKLLPVRATFKTTKTNIYFNAKDAIVASQSDTWKDKSEQHRKASTLSQVNLRTIHTVKLRAQTFKGSGMKGHIGASFAQPVSDVVVDLLGKSVTNVDWLNAMQECQEALDRRIESVTNEYFNA
jgi:hypothetical protein